MLSGTRPRERYIKEATLKCLRSNGQFVDSIKEPRYHLGWFNKASRYLEATLKSEGINVSFSVIQQQMSSSSTLLKKNSSHGWYYLKAPDIETNEIKITAKISELFPSNSPQLLAICEDLNCFISKGFQHINLEPSSTRNVAMQWGEIHKRAMEHIETLSMNGCPIRDPSSLVSEMEIWLKQDIMKKWYPLDPLISAIDIAKKLCVRLSEYKIPQTLVHGDFSFRHCTLGRDEKTVLFFDWEFAYIGHSFCEFHELYESLSKDEVDEYLSIWEEYEPLERAREAFQIARVIGLCMALWCLHDRFKSYDAQSHPELQRWCFLEIHRLPSHYAQAFPSPSIP